MKWMKYSCPFGGKQYPFYLVVTVPWIVAFALVFSGNLKLMMCAMFLLPIVILVVCFLIEQRLTPDERQIIAATEPPLWQPITEDLQERIRAEEKPPEGSPLPMILCLCGFFVVFFLVICGFNGISIAIAAAVLLTVLVFVLASAHQSDVWRQVDDTAVYIEVPIHHMYDVRHTRTTRGIFQHYSEVWYASYLVFYLHNGRYTLRVPQGEGAAHSIVILKFQGHTRWLLQ